MNTKSALYTTAEIENISAQISVLDYFLHLENKGKVKFERKTGNDQYFRTENNKFSVSENGYYDFKTAEGGQIIKAVMQLEKLEWKDALEFVKNFNGQVMEQRGVAEKKIFQFENENAPLSEVIITNSISPNNEKLISYFEERGISKDILLKNTRQIHYETAGKNYFGIGIENLSEGIEIRNPIMKTKIGKNDISEIKGSKDELVVFEGMTDMLSFLELLKTNNQKNNRTLISLNSTTNLDKFLSRYSDFSGKMFLCLDGDSSGNLATQKIINELKGKNIKDIRAMYQISESENNDLNDYLVKKINLQNKNINLVEPKNPDHETTTIKSNRISETQQVERKSLGENAGKISENFQSEQNGIHPSGQNLGSNNAGNGSTIASRSDLSGRGSNESINRTQQKNVGKNEGRENSLGGRFLENSTNIAELDALISKYKGQKMTNEQVAEVVSAACFVSNDKEILLRENLKITNSLKDICNQFESGGTAKEGRGILDEYYTDGKIVEVVCNLIKDQFKKYDKISVLEPSVGSGNFIYAAKGLPVKSNVTGFEINETTAKIAKILHPDATINLRSFETEFIDEKGNKKESKDFSDKYDLVLGNPPYGEHRGLYKGLGEESKISKYEDYFVKRGLDSLKEGGILAMVLPSGWLNRQKKLENADLQNAFRLPNGIFSGTQVGTDIIILKKSPQKISQNISTHFEANPQNILGEIREKTNRFGRFENFVYGSLEEAINLLENLQNKKETVRIGNLFEDLSTEENTSQTVNSSEKIHISNEENPLNSEKQNEFSLKIAQDKTELVLQKLNEIKFKSPSILSEIRKYSNLKIQIGDNSKSFPADKLEEIIKKSDRILQSQNGKNSEYEIQSQPLIKKGILKYQFTKQDEIVNSSLQNSSDITEEQIAAFKATSYDGTIKNHSRHFNFANYYKEKYVHDFYYAEGNIYEKLEQLEEDFKNDWGIGGLEKKQYEKQKALLENVLPKLKDLEEISISPNHEFVHKFDLGQIEKEQYNPINGRTEEVTVDYNLAEKFKDFVSNLPSDAFSGSSSWEVKSFVDNETVTGSDKERNALIRERRKAAANDLFSKFIREELTEELRDRFVKDFNRNYNHIHVPEYSKFPLFSKIHQNFKGEELRLTEVQKAGIGRQTTKGVGLLAHEVGFGKTLSGILSMHEAMERGNATKPLIVVPNDTILKQWVETIFETIPNAKVNVLGNLGKDYNLSKFDNKEGEISIVTYEGFNNIGFSSEITEKLSEKFNYISTSELKNLTNTEREQQIELQKEKEIDGKMMRGKVYDWEDFGFDHLTYDEVHNANHIVGKVKIEDRRFSSDFRNQNQQTSKLGINTWMAAQYIQDKQNGRNVTLLSATPFTNKPLEYYSILSLIANKRLEESGYFNVNNFFETFMEADNDMEIDAKGDVKFKANVRRFKNNSLFQQLLSEFIDVKGEEDNAELIRPNKINKEYKIEQNDLTKEHYDLLNQNFNDREKGAILTHILNARLIAVSPYLSLFYNDAEPTIIEFIENSPKLNETMNLIRQNKMDIPDSGQIIYSELAVAQFPKLKEYLINEVGYKPEEIGIITGATSKKNRISIQDDFNSGKIKIVIGSEAIQEGMNLQENTTDVYLLTLPYNFTSLRQIEGRAWRQGNKNENVRVNFMLTNDSIDVFMLQKLQAKQARYLEAMKKGANVLDISDISTSDLKTSIITNPETRASIEIELIKKRLESEKNKYLADSAFVLRKYEDFTKAQGEVTKAEMSYNRINEYAKNTSDSNSDYWENQLPFYQKTIDLAKVEVQKTMENLAEKGVNVAEIEKQTKATEVRILELDQKLEELPTTRENLIIQFKEEKLQQIKQSEHKNYLKERFEENMLLFNFPHSESKIIELNKDEILPQYYLPETNMEQSRMSSRR
ncbi:Eco57I restriction-modification methylase domain-containing protein [Chryseobacterium sp. MP_3.2]|uniref:Eco57I restriction-modification methylase domain-containing protein n=1 Tax=Chryseobacterium sp. MP_3.2 TaxID=3071712 RepID=UPI002DFF285C|nr:outer membrane lipopolysaccharide assembly protein LptE/RlpB [Chryseobacterium sp. MP_3.2]